MDESDEAKTNWTKLVVGGKLPDDACCTEGAEVVIFQISNTCRSYVLLASGHNV